jgi:hypothetical protein
VLKPRVWFDAVRVHYALKNYSVYSPPHMRNEIKLLAGAAEENFDYFQTTRSTRMASFRIFMKNFGVDATTDDKGLVAVSEWFKRYGGLLLYYKPRTARTLLAFVDHDPQWVGKHIGINVVWDIGIYVGDCTINRCPSAHWDLNTGTTHPASRRALGFQRPCVAGLEWTADCDPITKVFVDSQALCRLAQLGHSPHFLLTDLMQLVSLWSKANPPA